MWACPRASPRCPRSYCLLLSVRTQTCFITHGAYLHRSEPGLSCFYILYFEMATESFTRERCWEREKGKLESKNRTRSDGERWPPEIEERRSEDCFRAQDIGSDVRELINWVWDRELPGRVYFVGDELNWEDCLGSTYNCFLSFLLIVSSVSFFI